MSTLPDRLVVLTFDDGPKSQFTFAAPLLKECGFNATFYITEGLRFLVDELRIDIDHIDTRCAQYGITRPTTFCYPGYSNGPEAIEVLRQRGFRFARRGVAPEYPYHDEGGRGPAYDPAVHDPLLIPTTGASGPQWGFDDFLWAVDQARDGQVAVLTFHGVPDLDHPWVHTEPDLFERYVAHLRDNDFTVVALRDLDNFIDG